jgi:hypothetical protein
MKRIVLVVWLSFLSAPVWSADDCAGKVTAQVLMGQRDLRQGMGLVINHCGRPVQAEVVVMALNADGFPVAMLRTHIVADASPISLFFVDLPFVQSTIRLSGYNTVVAGTENIPVLSRARVAPLL